MTVPSPRPEEGRESIRDLKDVLEKLKIAPIDIKDSETLKEALARMNQLVRIVSEAAQRKERYLVPLKTRVLATEAMFDGLIAEARRQLQELAKDKETYWKKLDAEKQTDKPVDSAS